MSNHVHDINQHETEYYSTISFAIIDDGSFYFLCAKTDG